jgi:hypothetical protein
MGIAHETGQHREMNRESPKGRKREESGGAEAEMKWSQPATACFLNPAS